VKPFPARRTRASLVETRLLKGIDLAARLPDVRQKCLARSRGADENRGERCKSGGGSGLVLCLPKTNWSEVLKTVRRAKIRIDETGLDETGEPEHP
jgi:hypothetical protein